MKQSFLNALEGLKSAYKEESNFKIEVWIGILLFVAVFFLPLESFERISILGLIFFVLSLELINTAIENLGDAVTKEENVQIKKVKDISAAFVFLGSIGAFFIGMYILLSLIF